MPDIYQQSGFTDEEIKAAFEPPKPFWEDRVTRKMTIDLIEDKTSPRTGGQYFSFVLRDVATEKCKSLVSFELKDWTKKQGDKLKLRETMIEVTPIDTGKRRSWTGNDGVEQTSIDFEFEFKIAADQTIPTAGEEEEKTTDKAAKKEPVEKKADEKTGAIPF